MTIHISKYSRLGLLEILILQWKYSNERIARIAIAIPCQRREGGGLRLVWSKSQLFLKHFGRHLCFF